ncbi:hypothetical protein [Streptomyces asoensis]|uniref:hypothetical protein n=1 Tax=Streptomyces asoensis TaxID=249586 RepID=UPI0033F2EDB2
MLMNLLPGLREIRTPLASGYIWLLALWFSVRDHVPERAEASGLLLSAYRLMDVVGTPATLAAASFVAYLLGQLQVEPDTARKGVIRVAGHRGAQYLLRDIPKGGWEGKPPAVSQSSITTLGSYIETRQGELDPAGTRDPSSRFFESEDMLTRVTSDLRTLALHLQVNKPELFQDYDRLASEAAFRVNVGAALGGLSLVLAIVGGNAAFLVGLIITLLMVRSGIFRQQTANDLLIETLTSRIVTSYLLGEYEAVLQRRAESRQAVAEEGAPNAQQV